MNNITQPDSSPLHQVKERVVYGSSCKIFPIMAYFCKKLNTESIDLFYMLSCSSSFLRWLINGHLGKLIEGIQGKLWQPIVKNALCPELMGSFPTQGAMDEHQGNVQLALSPNFTFAISFYLNMFWKSVIGYKVRWKHVQSMLLCIKRKKQRKKCFQHYLIKDVKIALFVRLMSDSCLFQEVGINFSPLQSSATILQAYELSKSGSQWKWSAITWKWLKKPKLSKPFYKNPTSYHKESN